MTKQARRPSAPLPKSLGRLRGEIEQFAAATADGGETSLTIEGGRHTWRRNGVRVPLWFVQVIGRWARLRCRLFGCKFSGPYQVHFTGEPAPVMWVECVRCSAGHVVEEQLRPAGNWLAEADQILIDELRIATTQLLLLRNAGLSSSRRPTLWLQEKLERRIADLKKQLGLEEETR